MNNLIFNKITALAAVFILTSSSFISQEYSKYKNIRCDEINFEELNYENGTIKIKVKEENLTLEWADNKGFINSSKQALEEETTIQTDYDTVFLKFYTDKKGSINAKTYVLNNHEHVGTMLEHVPATCSENGFAKIQCNSCDNLSVLVEEAFGCNMTIYEEVVSTCIDEGYKTLKCSRCENTEKIVIEKAEHKLGSYKITVYPTCSTNGTEESICNNCNHKETRSVPKTTHLYVYNGEINLNNQVGISYKCQNCGAQSNKTFTKQHLGDYIGIIELKELNITVPVYLGQKFKTQNVCDAKDSAAIQRMSLNGKNIVIGDHYYQNNFNNIRYAKVGSTIMYYGGHKYLCVENDNGTNIKSDLLNKKGESVFDNGIDLYLYTCNDNTGKSVRVVGFMKVS